MIDITQFTGREGESSKIKKFVGRTPGILKSKFLSVIGNSNELINGISNKFDLTLSLSSTTNSDDCCEDDEEINVPADDESIDISSIDYESRRVKERRAHEEILSGKFRHPNITPRNKRNGFNLATNGKQLKSIKPASCTSTSSSSSSTTSSCDTNSFDSKSPNRGDTDLEEEIKNISGLLSMKNNSDGKEKIAQKSVATPVIDVIPPSSSVPLVKTTEDPLKVNGNKEDMDVKNATTSAPAIKSYTSKSSTLTSLNDPPGLATSVTSVESSGADLLMCMRSESINSVPSWASSISLDNHCEENNVKEFMRKFVDILFTNSSSIGLELKSEFGHKTRLETGRLWFSRYVNAQRVKSKKVDETTFYSLVQYFAIILFECAESEDYSPAKNLMNMCFTFYHEVEVPGCEPYREYLFTYLRQQPIWHNLRFWNAAFFDAVQCERLHRPIPKRKKINKPTLDTPKDKEPQIDLNQELGDVVHDETSSSISPQRQQEEIEMSYEEMKEDQQYQQNITFGKLGTFTCNMHAFGLTKDLSLEFLKKQCVIANLPKDQEKLLRDNINRMYLETDKWGAS